VWPTAATRSVEHVREFGGLGLRPFCLDSSEDRRRDGILSNEVAACELDLARNTTLDRLAPSPCAVNTVGARRHDRRRAAPRVWVTKLIRVDGSVVAGASVLLFASGQSARVRKWRSWRLPRWIKAALEALAGGQRELFGVLIVVVVLLTEMGLW
jgi:hypothetical protein